VGQPQTFLVRGRCACGKRYRIRNARAGITVTCPNCGRPITISGADLSAAQAEAQLIPVQSDSAELLEAIPVDYGELRLAREGSRPGLTGGKAFEHEAAQFAAAIRGSSLLDEDYVERRPAAAEVGARIAVEPEPVHRGFVHDLLASFYFAGVPRNALNIVLIAAACSLMVVVQYAFVLFPLLLLFMVPIYGIILLYTIQFYWAVLRHTAAGEDEIPFAQTDWSFWHDGFKPLVWMVVISLLCSAPFVLLRWFGRPPLADNPALLWLLLGAGWFFWPVAVMSVALGNTILFVRPDWLIRCVVGIGPIYLVAWVTTIVAVSGWYVFLRYWGIWIWIPVAGFAVNLYFGYVVFRTLGLLFRHFRARFPWKY
jgi:hypothetical protein